MEMPIDIRTSGFNAQFVAGGSIAAHIISNMVVGYGQGQIRRGVVSAHVFVMGD
jgi:hypothetical protein